MLKCGREPEQLKETHFTKGYFSKHLPSSCGTTTVTQSTPSDLTTLQFIRLHTSLSSWQRFIYSIESCDLRVAPITCPARDSFQVDCILKCACVFVGVDDVTDYDPNLLSDPQWPCGKHKRVLIFASYMVRIKLFRHLLSTTAALHISWGKNNEQNNKEWDCSKVGWKR